MFIQVGGCSRESVQEEVLLRFLSLAVLAILAAWLGSGGLLQRARPGWLAGCTGDFFFFFFFFGWFRCVLYSLTQLHTVGGCLGGGGQKKIDRPENLFGKCVGDPFFFGMPRFYLGAGRRENKTLLSLIDRTAHLPLR